MGGNECLVWLRTHDWGQYHQFLKLTQYQMSSQTPISMPIDQCSSQIDPMRCKQCLSPQAVVQIESSGYPRKPFQVAIPFLTVPLFLHQASMPSHFFKTGCHQLSRFLRLHLKSTVLQPPKPLTTAFPASSTTLDFRNSEILFWLTWCIFHLPWAVLCQVHLVIFHCVSHAS